MGLRSMVHRLLGLQSIRISLLRSAPGSASLTGLSKVQSCSTSIPHGCWGATRATVSLCLIGLRRPALLAAGEMCGRSAVREPSPHALFPQEARLALARTVGPWGRGARGQLLAASTRSTACPRLVPAAPASTIPVPAGLGSPGEQQRSGGFSPLFEGGDSQWLGSVFLCLSYFFQEVARRKCSDPLTCVNAQHK